MKSVFDEMISLERKLASVDNIPPNTFDSNFFNKIEQIFAVGDYYYFIVDVVNFKVEYLHQNQEKILGYSMEKFKKNLVMDQIHPDDVPYFLNFGAEIGRFFAQLPPDKVMKYKTRYDFRVRKINGDYIRILHQGLPIQIGENGGMMRKLIIHTDVTHLKKDNSPSTLSFIGLNDEPSFINVEVNTLYKPSSSILSVRERQILILLAEGKSRLIISEQLFISKFTLDNHRKNMLEKTKTKSISELISKAIHEGWI